VTPSLSPHHLYRCDYLRARDRIADRDIVRAGTLFRSRDCLVVIVPMRGEHEGTPAAGQDRAKGTRS